MKILLITPFFYEGSIMGSVKYLLKLCNALTDKNKLTVFTTKSRDISYTNFGEVRWNKDFNINNEKIGRINVRRFDVERTNFTKKYLFLIINKINEASKIKIFNRLFRLYMEKVFYNNLGPNSKKLEETLKKECNNYDLIILSYFPFKTVYSCGKILKNNNKRYILVPLYHENDSYHNKDFLKKSLEMSDVIMELNEYSKGLFYSIYKKPVYNIKGYVLNPVIPKKEEIINFKREKALVNKFIVLIVGRKERVKNYKTIIDSLKLIKDKNIVILFIGKDVDKKKINSKQVVYLEAVDNKTLSLAYSSSDILVNMSLNESLCQVFLEAWSYSLPVIGNKKCNSIKSLINEGKDGFLCDSAEDLAKKIRFLKNNPLVKKKIGFNGKKRIDKEFCIDVYKKNILKILSELKEKFYKQEVLN